MKAEGEKPDPHANEALGCLRLWAGLLVLVLGAGSALYFYAGFAMGQRARPEDGGNLILLSVFLSVGAAGAAALVARRRFGFWVTSAAFAAVALLQVAVSGGLTFLLGGALNIAVLWWLVARAGTRLE